MGPCLSREEHAHAHEHGHGHGEKEGHGHGHEHDGDCCEHGHGENGHGHQDKEPGHGHGHGEEDHGHGHDENGDCCEHGHGEHGHGHEEKEHGHGHGNKEKEHGHGHSHGHEDGHMSEVVALGTVNLGGATFAVDREGDIAAGKASTFGVELVSAKAAVPKDAWLQGADGKKVCEPATGEGHDQHWHFTVTPTGPAATFVLRVGGETAAIDLAPGAAPCNDGILTILKSQEGGSTPTSARSKAQKKKGKKVKDAVLLPCGLLELKLHDDAGDLELWLYSSTVGGKPKPFDIPKETVICVTFPSHGDKAIEMRIRNAGKNEDEDLRPNMRGAKTNYFIFPGESGSDAAWLQGEKWRGNAVVTFEADGNSYACDPFVLVPHTAL